MELVDRLSLTTLPARYAQAVDRRDARALGLLMTADVLVVLPAGLSGSDTSTRLRGSDEVSRRVVDSVSHLIATRHVVGQQILDLDAPDTARGETYCTAHHVYARGNTHRDNRIALRYLDEFARVDGTWLFTRRELVVDFAEDVPVTIGA